MNGVHRYNEVMRHFLPALLLLLLLALIGCGNGNNNSTNTTTTPSTPGEVVKELAYAMEAGDAEKIKELLPDLEAKLGGNMYTLAQWMKENATASGGITDFKIDNESIRGDKAVVTATLTNGNGQSSTDTFNLIKKDGKWVVEIDDSEIDATPKAESEAEPEPVADDAPAE